MSAGRRTTRGDPETGEYLRAWDGGIVQEILTSQEKGLRRVTPIEMTIEEAYEILDEFEQARSEAYAEAGSGGISLGYGTEGAYEAANAAAARFGDGGRRVRAARARIKEA